MFIGETLANDVFGEEKRLGRIALILTIPMPSALAIGS